MDIRGSQIAVSGSAGGFAYALLQLLHSAISDGANFVSHSLVHTSHETDTDIISIGDQPSIIIHVGFQVIVAFVAGILFLPTLEVVFTLRRILTRWLRQLAFMPVGTRTFGRHT